MSRRTALSLFVALTLFASTGDAQIVAPQPVSFTGVVETLDISPGVSILCPPGNFTLRCSQGLSFRSSTIDLRNYVGQNVRLVGVNTHPGCPTFEITAVQDPPPASLTLCGTPEGLGCAVRLRSGPGGISQHFLFVALAPGFVPLNVDKGSFLLGDPNLILATASGGFPPEGAAFDFVIPVDFSLVGIDVFMQTARRDVGPVGPIRFANAVCFTPIGLTIFCAQPDC